MATSTRVRSSASAEREHHRTNLWAQLARFVGLFLSPFLGLLVAWFVHVWASGVHVQYGPIDWEVDTPRGMPTIAAIGASLLTMWLATFAVDFAAHRAESLQKALRISVITVGLMFATAVGIGPSYLWSVLFILAGWFVAVIWSIARLDVARNDKQAEGDKGEGLLEKLGVSKLTRFKSKVVHDEETGEPLRIDVEVEHDRDSGETVKVLQDGLDHLESAVAGPPGMSTATGHPGRADRSHVSLQLTDPFIRNIQVGPLTAPGGSIADLTTVADYADGKPGFVTTAAGKNMPSSTSYGLIGTTRAGKTGTETQLLTNWGSRIDWACLYLNQAKGLQDIRPLLPIIEAAVIAENGETGLGEYVTAFGQAKAIMAYRQQQLAQFAVSAWSPRCCDPDPMRRPTRLGANGKRIVMERMPFLTVHVGEADAILSSGRAEDLSVFIASKGLSLGVNSGWSLQRPDWKAMPTGLRAQIGLWFVHGLNNGDDEDFVIDDDIRKAGAHPGKWGQRKPGQHYMIGPGIDESRFPIALKTRFLVGNANGPDGEPIDFDTLNDRYMSEMLRRNTASAAKLCPLDRGSAEATDGWWDAQAAKTVDLRSRMLTGATADPAPQTATANRKPSVFAGAAIPQPADDQDGPSDTEMEESMEDFNQEAAEARGELADELYDSPQEAAAVAAVDLTGPAATPEVDADPLADSEEDDKPKASTPEEARAVVRQTLVRMIDDPRFADPKVPGTAIVGPTAVYEECGLNSRPWVSDVLARLMSGGGGVDDGVVMERVGKPAAGRYRVRRTGGSGNQQ